MKNLKQFLKDLHVPNTYIQYGGVNHVEVVSGQGDLFKYIEESKSKDLYFLANVDKQSPMRSVDSKGNEKYPEKNRGSDVDIINKNYV